MCRPFADPECFVRGGSNFDNVFVVVLVHEWKEDLHTIVSGPSSAHQRNAMPWRFAGVPMMAQH